MTTNTQEQVCAACNDTKLSTMDCECHGGGMATEECRPCLLCNRPDRPPIAAFHVLETTGDNPSLGLALQAVSDEATTHCWDYCVSVIEFLTRDAEMLKKVQRKFMEDAVELLEVADLRGDSNLPHPSDDPILWTARMQEAWDIFRETVEGLK